MMVVISRFGCPFRSCKAGLRVPGKEKRKENLYSLLAAAE